MILFFVFFDINNFECSQISDSVQQVFPATT